LFRIAFFLFPLFFVLCVAPIILARKRRGGSTWFPAQIITLLGFLAGLVALDQVAWLVLPRAPK